MGKKRKKMTTAQKKKRKKSKTRSTSVPTMSGETSGDVPKAEEMLFYQLNRVMHDQPPEENLYDTNGNTWEDYTVGWGFNNNPGSRNHNLLGKAINCSRWGDPVTAGEDLAMGLGKEAEGFTDSGGVSWYHEGFEVLSRTYGDYNASAQLAALCLLDRAGVPSTAVRDALRRIWGFYALTAVAFLRGNKRSSGWDWEGPWLVAGGLRSQTNSHINPAMNELYCRATGQSYKSKKTPNWEGWIDLISDFGLSVSDSDHIVAWQNRWPMNGISWGTGLSHIFDNLLVPAPKTLVGFEIRCHPDHLVVWMDEYVGGNTGSTFYGCAPTTGSAETVVSRTGTDAGPSYDQDKNALLGFPYPGDQNIRSGSKYLGKGYGMFTRIGSGQLWYNAIEYANLKNGEKNPADQFVLTDALPPGEPTHIFRSSKTERLHLVEREAPPVDPPPEPEPPPTEPPPTEPPPEENDPLWRRLLDWLLAIIDGWWNQVWGRLKPLLAAKVLRWILGLGVVGLILLLMLWC